MSWAFGSRPNRVAEGGARRATRFEGIAIAAGTPQQMAGSLVVKFGGSIATGVHGDPVLRDIADLQQAGICIALVHGGGPAVDAVMQARGITTRRIAGLRVTDAATLTVVREVLGRRVNATIVAALHAAGGDARPVAGDDGVFIARRAVHPAGDLGFVGDISRVETGAVRAVWADDAIAVISPIGADEHGQRYNINADTAAGALAAALGVETYVVVTDVDRVRVDRNDPATGIARMTLDQADAYRRAGVFVDGMIPKIEAALVAVRGGARRAVICGAGPGVLAAALAGAGTEIVA